MFFNIIKFIIPLLTCMSCDMSPNFISLKIKDNWEFKATQDTLWMPAKVPGTIHTNLIDNGIIEDPFYRLNEKKIQWIDKKDWEYKTSFTIDNSVFEKENIELIFKGLDTYANIYVNDSLVLKTDNMFIGWEVNCKPYLKRGANKLKIVFDSPIKQGLKKRESLGYRLPNAVNDQSENGGLGKKQVAVFSRKAGYHFGWDWGPRIVSSGIWQDIELNAWNKLIIRDTYIKQQTLTLKEATLNTKLNIEATHSFKAPVVIKVDSVVVVKKEVEFKKGKNEIKIPFTIKNPELWWTNGLGSQKLYDVQTEIFLEDEIIALNTRKIGIKTLEVIQKKDSIGKSFYFELNGHPIFMKGANYIPQDVFLSSVTVKDYEKIIKDMVAANFNMIRVWGGGIYEKDIFYDLCDQYGILVWQDFMFACAMYPGDTSFLKNVKKEAIYNVKRLRNHTSIALWCGNNENLIAWKQWGWIHEVSSKQGEKIVAKVWKGYQDVFHKILPEVVEDLDADTFYWASSPTSARGEVDNLTSGDSHYWKVWGHKAPFSTFNTEVPRFMSEYGFQSFPEFASVKKYTKEQDWDIYSDVMKSHQRSSIGNKNIEFYMKSRYKKPKDFKSFLYVSQLLQAKGMKIAIEAHRRNMPYCMGSLYWQINDCWPVASWSTIDYYGNWKASHYTVKELYKPVKIMFYKEDKNINLYIVSDKLNDKKVDLRLKIMDFNGEILKTIEKSITIKGNRSGIYHTLKNKQKVNKKRTCVIGELIIDGTIIDESVFFFKEAKKLVLSKPDININVIKNNERTFKIELKANTLVKNLRLTANIEGHFSNNYFNMIPNKKYYINFKSRETKSVLEIKKSLEIISLYDSYQ